MKKLLAIVCLFSSVVCNAQSYSASINPSSADDYIVLLQKCGYMSYSADVSSLLKENDKFWIEPVIQHYKNGVLQENEYDFGIRFSNRDSQTICEKVRIGFAPDANKLVRYLNFFVTETGAITLPLVFDEQKDPETGEVSNTYGFRQFCIDSIQLNTFIPIAMCGAFWYDNGRFRFCGEDILTPDLSDGILKSLPDYYIIGMRISK